MSGTEPKVPSVEDLARNNPKIDSAQVREVQALLDLLKQEGVPRRSYGIASPHERRSGTVRIERASSRM